MLQATRITLSLLAQRIEQLTGQIHQLDQRLARLVEHHFPQLLTPVGIGPDSAAILMITMGDNPGRLHGEASFAALCGVSPIEHSSGRERCWRLNRGGDRQANSALHRIVHARLRFDPRTRDYYERSIKESKTRRERVRCLKRYVAREFFHLVRPESTLREAAQAARLRLRSRRPHPGFQRLSVSRGLCGRARLHDPPSTRFSGAGSVLTAEGR
ncbi:transposase [Streptomyces inhibens]|uniref:transposase n=1 Tax=Streptomyces inhibens TaxID=2293571 RepID=UPI001EE752B1|nr:transposase [Streptomyces inhibens]UKY48820.1 transposase [Streptomyces inhibens]